MNVGKRYSPEELLHLPEEEMSILQRRLLPNSDSTTSEAEWKQRGVSDVDAFLKASAESINRLLS